MSAEPVAKFKEEFAFAGEALLFVVPLELSNKAVPPSKKASASTLLRRVIQNCEPK